MNSKETVETRSQLNHSYQYIVEINEFIKFKIIKYKKTLK